MGTNSPAPRLVRDNSWNSCHTVLLLLLLLLAWPASGGARVKTVAIRHAVPEWVRYETTHSDGTRELWSEKPKLLRVDGSGAAVFWWTELGFYDAIDGGMVPKGSRWERSLRRVR